MGEFGISEFTFGYAFLYEQTRKNWKDLKAAPILPNLHKEKEEGWDAHLPLKGADYYYQFKLSDYLKRRNSKFFHEPHDYYTDPYFRIMLYRDKLGKYPQHIALKKFAKKHPLTYYVAPEFTTEDNFSEIFLSKDVSNFSRLIPLRRCKKIDDNDSKPHCITYQKGQRKWRLHSKAEECDESYFGKELHDFYFNQVNPKHWHDIDEKYVFNLYKKISETVDEISNEGKNEKEKLEVRYIEDYRDANPRMLLEKISELLGANFGLTLVLVGEPRK
jgi:hypothetical protein